MSSTMPVTSTPPQLQSVTLSGGNTLTLTFDSAILAGTGNLVITDGHSQNYIGKSGPATRITGASDTRTLDVANSGVVEISDHTVTVHLATPLAAGVEYSLTMGAGVLTAGTAAFAGIASTNLFYFTAPAVTAPTAVLDPTINIIDNGISGDHITTELHQVLSGSYSGELAGNSFVEVSLDNGATWHTATANSGSWSYTGDIDTAWAMGNSTMLARIANTAGATSGMVRQDYVYSAGPSALVTSGSLALSMDTGTSSTDLVTGVAAQTVSGSYTGTLAPGDQIQISTDGVSWQNVTVNTGAQTWSLAATLTSGTHTLSARVVDSYGNSSTAVSHSYTLDTTAPTVSLAGKTPTLLTATDSGTLGDNITSYSSPTIVVGDLIGAHIAAGDLLQIVDTNHGNAVIGTHVITLDELDTNGALLNHNYNVLVTAPLTSGVHNLVARVADVAGNTATASSALALTISGAPPVASGTVGWLYLQTNGSHSIDGEGHTNETAPGFSVDLNGISGLVAGNIIQVVDTGGQVVAAVTLTEGNLGESGHTYVNSLPNTSSLADGTYNLSLRVVNADGDAAPNIISPTLVINLDTVAPTRTTTTVDPAAHVDQAFSINFSEAVTYSGEASFLFVSGGNAIGGSGHFTDTMLEVTPYSSLVAGSDYTIVVSGGHVTDLAGNAYTGATLLSFHTEGTAPPAPTATVDAAISFTDNGVSDSDHITSAYNQTVTGTYTGTLQPNENIQVSLDNGLSWGPASVDESGHTWSYYGTIDVPSMGGASDHPYQKEFNSTILVRASNGADLHNTAASVNYTYDSLVPTFTDIVFSNDTGISSTDLITNAATQTISGHYTGILNAGDVVEVSVNWGSWVTATAANGSWTLPGPVTLSNSSGQIEVRVTDVVGNSGSYSQYYHIYTAASLATKALTLNPGADTGMDSGDHITKTLTSVRLNVVNLHDFHVGDIIEVHDALSNTVVGSYTVASNGVEYGDMLVNHNPSITLDSSKIHDGNYQLTATVRDISGNVGASTPIGTPLTVTLDTVAPSATGSIASLSLTADSDGGTSSSDGATYVTTPSFSVDLSGVTGLQAGDVIQVIDTSNSGRIIAAVQLTSADLSGGMASSVVAASLATLDAGTHDMRAQVADVAGNVASVAVANFQVKIDTAAPQLSSSNVSDPWNAPVSGDLVLTFNENIALGGASPVFTLTSGDYVTTATATVSGDQLTLHFASPLVAGSDYTLTLTEGHLADTAGNIGYGVDSPNTTLYNFHTTGTAPPPAAAINSTLHFASTGTGGDYVTSINNQTVTGTYSGTLTAHDEIEVSMDEGNSWYAATVTGNSWSYSGSVDTIKLTSQDVEFTSKMMARVTNTLTGLSSTTTEQSYTYDHKVPLLQSSTPASGASSVDPGGLHDLVLQFGEDIVLGSGAHTVHIADVNNASNAQDVTVASGDISGNTLTVHLSSTLTSNTDYRITLVGVADAAGNPAYLSNVTNELLFHTGNNSA